MSDKNTDSMEFSSIEETILFPGYSSLADFTKDGYKILMDGIKQANSLPAGRDWNFYTTFNSFKSVINKEANQIIDNIDSILHKNEAGGTMRNLNLEAKTERLIDANDIILERVANSIDEMNGIRNVEIDPVKLQTVSVEVPVNINGSWNRNSNPTFSVGSYTTEKGNYQVKAQTIRLLAGENIIRPQKLFRDKIDNSNDNPWEPRIKEKPNSLKPLAIFLEESDNGRQFSHPYLYELERFNLPENLLTKGSIVRPKLISDTPLIEINNPEQLPSLVEDLHKYDTIAVDLEHHSYRTFMGITCLMQISTYDTDYLIDTLALRSDLYILNEVFTKPNILKIFHGAHSDILWLQRDLSLYVVNMFDTYFAAKQLGYSSLSLASLMQRFCNFVPNKQFQLADWRIRPLPQELKNYAREDTHYLAFIYHNMKNELIAKANGNKNLIQAVFQESTELCKKRYFKPIWHEEIHLEFYRRCNRMFDNRQMFALKELYKWRDNISRQEDESTGYVLPNNMLLEIAERLPREMQGILACCRPVPPLVRANLLDLHKIILKALEKPFEEPILKEDTRARGTTKKVSKINVDSPLYCPHDLSKSEEFRDDLPTMLGDVNNKKLEIQNDGYENIERSESVCSVFNNSLKTQERSTCTKLLRFRENFKFLSPFDRYQLVKPFIEAREKKVTEEKEKETEEKVPNHLETEVLVPLEKNVERTDEERIESIRSHYMNLARDSNSKKAKVQSLLEMGGSKKRKREEFMSGVTYSPSQSQATSYQSPIPNLNTSRLIPINVEHNNEPNRKQQKLNNEQKNLNQKKKKKNRAKNNIDVREALLSGADIGEASFSGQHLASNQNQQQSNKKGNVNSPGLSSYDYSMVDFRQFRGGAGRIEPKGQIKSKYKARNKIRLNKRGNNKSAVFGKKVGI
ncbi:exosome component 10 [Sitophilus oryzae]|uniref:Exosome complex component 10 homolog n=1 Tax=Sitophilus oryzae TaxID=7048 RepID=A0A6J2Y5T0_SITOR|nr:exosome component 10 [Sitophilus oryzae]